MRHGRTRAALHGRPVPGHLTGYRRRNHHLHDHQQAENLHGASGQGLGRRSLDDDDLRRPGRRRRPSTPRPSRPRPATSAFFTYPISTPVTVGETPVPAGYAATIRCGDGRPRSRTRAHPSRSPPPPSVASRSRARSPTLSSSRTSRWSRNGSARRARRRSSSTRTAWRPSTPRPSRSRAATAPPSPTRSRRRSRSARSLRADRLRGHDPVRRRRSSRLRRRPFAVTSPATDGATITCTIVNTQQLSKIRVIKNWSGTPSTATIFVDQDGVAPFDDETVAIADGDSAEFEYPVSTPAFVGEIARADRLHRHDPMRYGPCSRPLQRRPVRSNVAANQRRHADLHDQQQHHSAAGDRSGGQGMDRRPLLGDDLRRPGRRRTVRRRDGRDCRWGQHFL